MDIYSDQAIADELMSVGGLTAYIQCLLEDDQHLRRVWVTGEVSSVNHHRIGLFFTLQDPDNGEQINCVVWRSQVPKLTVTPVAGDQIIFLGTMKIYAKRGEYRLQGWQVLPAGEGLQAIRYRQLKARLAAEGLFDPENKRPLPNHPQIIAVVTSPQAAAWGDIQKTLVQRYPGLQVLLSTAIVQGENAPVSIMQAIDRVACDGRAEVIILARGGGAVEDLACFNEELVVRAIATSPIPVITGIGHERDESLADLTADYYAHTPTAAAEAVVPRLTDLVNQHQSLIDQLRATIQQRFTQQANQLQQLQQKLAPERILREIAREQQVISQKQHQLFSVTKQQLQLANKHLELLTQKLAVLDPQQILQRGYAVVRSEQGAIIKNSTQLSVGQNLDIQLNQGSIEVVIKSINIQ